MTSQEDTKKLVEHFQRRLQKLREQEAKFGFSTPPEVLLEIEDIEAKIEALRTRISTKGSTERVIGSGNIVNQGPNTSYVTNIGSVTGAVHTGSGDVVIGQISADKISNIQELVTVLGKIKEEIRIAQRSGLPEDIVDDTIIEIDAADREVKRNEPNPERVLKRLKNAKFLLEDSVEIPKVSLVVERLNKVIQSAPTIF